MLDIEEELPFSKNYTIAIDERGIILEGRVDPLISLSIRDLAIIYFMNDLEIEDFVNRRCDF